MTEDAPWLRVTNLWTSSLYDEQRSIGTYNPAREYIDEARNAHCTEGLAI